MLTIKGRSRYARPEPFFYSGKMMLRMDPELHCEVTKLALKKHMSINYLLNVIIEKAVNEEKREENDNR